MLAERHLIPLTAPLPGEQYAFEIDLDACTGCKACVTACHSLNGLDDDESWRSVGLLVGGSFSAPKLQTVTTACHHCVEPACLAGCPVDAYEKDPVTGIVSHLDDQCIGCGYCTLTCPYEVPRFNPTRGIVRKCDMCRGRLAEGEAPACAQACPNEAIRITLVETAVAVERAAGTTLVPGAPPSSVTVPTTVYRSERGLDPDMRAADHFSLRPAQAHPPLAVMLVLTQLAVGAVLVADGRWLAPASAVVAMAASVLHLGRPRYCFRAVLGVRHSWLSREILAFGAFAALAAVPVAPGLTAVAGVAGVACSVMVYAVTQRTWWRLRATAYRFGATTLLCGLAVALAVSPSVSLALMLAGVVVTKLGWEATVFVHHDGDLHRTAVLLRRDLATPTAWRFVLGGLGAALAFVLPAVALVALVAGELLERTLFFRAVTAPRMPGNLS
ncbi:MAG TPA: 4Fe-4S dicluster domain-containing protein [Acidimicrobiales bacterium]|nr:4Fe-4S dicluster domain-containing protein [Acidimicrobiales bacterium]